VEKPSESQDLRVAYGLYEQLPSAQSDSGARLCFQIAPLARGAADSVESLLWLAPCLRFLQSASLMLDQNLAAINALLYASVLLPAEDSSDQDCQCLTLWHTVECLRELINAFSRSSEQQEQATVCQRITQLQLVENQLEEALTINKNWRPPLSRVWTHSRSQTTCSNSLLDWGWFPAHC
jgi:hypothetical protein